MRALGGGGHLGVFLGHAANLRGNTRAGVQSSFIGITFRHWYSPVNSLHIFRTPFLKKISG